MRLKRLEIFGFKSFADKTVVHFGKGITGVVGPNGCGKSNIADAFRWVLGEQSARSLRGGKMQDVIFAGTTKRKALNYAEVTVVMDQVGGSLGIEYEEVAITRRLHRSGDSEYLLNGHPVRLKDIQNMFVGSGVGKNSFSIIEQGKVEQIIQSNPVERRVIFEEAAGILRFLGRKRETMRRLERTDQNIERVRDVHNEVRKQIEVLEKQAKLARNYKDNLARLDYLEKAVTVAKWDRLADQMGRGRDIEGQLEKQLSDQQGEVTGLQDKITQTKQQMVEDEEALKKAHEAVYKLEGEQRLQENESKNRTGRLEEIKGERVKLSEQTKQLIQEEKERAEQQRKAEKELEGLAAKLTKAEEAAVKAQQLYEQQLQAVDAVQQEYKEQQQQLVQAVSQAGAIKGELDKLEVQHASHVEAAKAIEQRQQALLRDSKGLSKLLADKRKEMEKTLSNVDKGKEQLNALQNELKELEQQVQKQDKERTGLRSQLAETRARQNVLEKMKAAMEGVSNGTKKLLTAAKDKGALAGLVKGLYEVLSIPKGQEGVAGQVLSRYANTLVVETKKDLDKVLAYARKEKLSDYSLYCVEEGGEFEPVKGAIVKADDSELSRRFLGNVVEAKDLEGARKLQAKQPAVEAIVDGTLLRDSRGVVARFGSGQHNPFQRESEIKELAAVAKQLEKECAALDAQIQKLEGKRQAVNKQRLELDQQVRRGEMGLVEANLAIQQTSSRQSEAEQQMTKLQEEEKQRKDAIEAVLKQKQECKAKHAEAAKAVTALEKGSSQFEQKVDSLKQKSAEAQQQQQQAVAAHQQLVKTEQSLKHQLEMIALKQEESRNQQKKQADQQAAAEALTAKLKAEQEQNQETHKNIGQMLKDAAAKRKECEAALAATKKAIAQLEKQIGQIRAKQKKVEKDFYQAGTSVAQLKTAQESLEKELAERFSLTVDQVRESEPPLQGQLEAAEKELRKLRQQVAEAGDINMTSIEEYEKSSQRHEFFVEQIGDLEGSRDELLQIIDELDGECRTRFEDTFTQIQANFRKNFALLFRGGEADLVLLDAKDILEAGIEIVAKPPGKKMRSIQLLSGGEKCLTAVALLFAIFEVRPAPFCILDEIDAPLDDSNVERFVSVVQQFIEQCQFIIITHNKVTMAIAHTLFGISMEERGVSKLLAMKFSQQHHDKSVDVGVVEQQPEKASSEPSLFAQPSV